MAWGITLSDLVRNEFELTKLGNRCAPYDDWPDEEYRQTSVAMIMTFSPLMACSAARRYVVGSGASVPITKR